MRNKVISWTVAILAIMIVLMPEINVYATEAESGDTAATEELTPEQQAEKEEEEKQKEMTRVYKLEVQSNQLKNWPEGPSTYGESSIVMDIDSGAILYAKNIDEQHYPASITKLVTALVALENGNLNDKVVITDDCISFLQGDYAQIGLKEGEKLSMEDTLYATLLASANEAAYAVAANAGNGYDWFIAQMNQRAQELGALNTNFVNANGIHDDNHYTTTRDMALISSELFHHEKALEIMQTLEYQIPKTNKDKKVKYIHQKHAMLNPDRKEHYKYAVGGKTGYTGEAKNTLVTYASKDGMNLVCVEMKTLAGKIYEDTENLLEYGFNNFNKVSIAGNDQTGHFQTVEDNGYVVLPESVSFEDLELEITQDAAQLAAGFVTYYYQNQPVGTASVTLSQEYLTSQTEAPPTDEPPEPISENTVEQPQNDQELPVKKAMIAFLITVCIIVFIFIMEAMLRRRKRRR